MNRMYRRHPLALALMLSLAFKGAAAAVLPTDPTIRSGVATITSDADSLTVDQVSPGLVIDWTTFQIGAGGTVNFTQASPWSADHHVTGALATQVDGTWHARGQQSLFNGNGIALGSTAKVDGDYLRLSTESTGNAVSLASGSIVTMSPLDGSLELFGGTVHTGANITAHELRATAWQDDVIQPDGSIDADQVDVQAAGDVHLDGYNQIGMLSAHAGGNLSVRNRDDIFFNTLVSGGTTDLRSDASITARDAGNALAGMVTVHSYWDTALNNTLPLVLGPSMVHEFVIMAPGVTFQGDTLASLGMSVLSPNQPIVQAAGRLYINGPPRFDAGNADILLESPDNWFDGLNGINAYGHDIRIASSTWLPFGDVTASGQLVLSPGGPDASVVFGGQVDAHEIVVHGGVTIGYGIVSGESIKGNLTLSGPLVLGTSGSLVYNGNIAGATALYGQVGSGSAALNGQTRVDGNTYANSGTLLIGDNLHPGATLEGDAVVNTGGKLGGTGHIHGDVTARVGGSVAPGDGLGTLNVDGSLTMEWGSRLSVDVGLPGPDALTPGQSDHLHVGGNVSADYTFVDVVNIGGMGRGLYTVLDYSGSYRESNGGFRIGDTPAGSAFLVYNNAVSKRIDLINVDNVAVNFWNGNGLASNTRAGGGSGTWSVRNANWADPGGTRHDIMTPQPGFAIFTGDRGDVHVDASGGPVTANGMQFATDGYTVSGDTVTLMTGDGSMPVIRVGTGTADGTATSASISSVLAGSQGLDKQDYGTLVLTGANTYTGGSRISQGTLAVADDRSLGDRGGDVTLDGGTLRIDGRSFDSTRRGVTLGSRGGDIDIADAGNTFTLPASIGGSGGLTKSGAGTLVLTGANTYAAGTTVKAGTLRGNTRSLSGYLFNDATTVFDQPLDGTYAGPIYGTGTLVKEGAGTLLLLGHNDFSGRTLVNAGTLQVGSAAAIQPFLGGDVELAHGASLRGNGIVGGSLIAHGTVAPGAPIGMLTVNGDATLAADSTLYIDTGGEGASLLAVQGHLTIDHARLVVDTQGRDWMTDTSYRFATGNGGVSGEFAPVSTDFAFLDAIVAYDGKDGVSLRLRRNAFSFADMASTPNQRAVAAAVDGLGAGHAVYDRVVSLDTGSVRDAFTALAGDLHASAQTLVTDDQRQVRDAISRHLLGGDDAYDGVRGDDGRGTSAWFSVLGHDADYDGNGNAGKIDASGSGAILGVDAMLDNDARIGALLGHAKQSMHERALAGSADVRSNQLGIYGDVPFGALTLRGAVVHARHAIDTDRRVALGDEAFRLHASRDADSMQAFAELGYAFHPRERTRLEPFAQLASLRWSGDRATERGGAVALAVEERDARVTTGKLGMHVATSFDAAGAIGLQATLAWQHASGDTTPEARLRFADGGQVFGVTGVPLARNATTVDAGVSFRLSPALRLDASYTGQYASSVTDHGGRVTLGWAF